MSLFDLPYGIFEAGQEPEKGKKSGRIPLHPLKWQLFRPYLPK